MITMGLVTMLGSYVLGAITKLVGLKAEQKHQRDLAHIQALSKEGELIETARKHDNKGIMWTRRTLALIIALAVVVWPVVAPVIFPGVSVSIGYGELHGGFWPFVDAHSIVQWKTFSGDIVITPLHTQLMAAIMGFYFGASNIKGK